MNLLSIEREDLLGAASNRHANKTKIIMAKLIP